MDADEKGLAFIGFNTGRVNSENQVKTLLRESYLRSSAVLAWKPQLNSEDTKTQSWERMI